MTPEQTELPEAIPLSQISAVREPVDSSGVIPLDQIEDIRDVAAPEVIPAESITKVRPSRDGLLAQTTKQIAESDLDPASFLAENPEFEQDPELVKHLADAYRQKKRTVSGTLKGAWEIAKDAAANSPRIAGNIAKAAITADPMGTRILRDPAGYAKNLLEIEASATENVADMARLATEGAQGLTDLAYEKAPGLVKGVVKIAEKVTLPGQKLALRALSDATGIDPSKPADSDDWVKRLLFSADMARKQGAAGTPPEGFFTSLMGVTPESLAKQGIVLDPTAVEDLSWVSDPMALLPAGNAFKIVSGTGRTLANAATKGAAEAFITKVGTAMKRGTGAALEKTGAAVTKVGKDLSTGGGRAAAAVTGALLGDASGAVGGMIAPGAVKKTGEVISKAGEIVGGKAPLPAPARVASKILGSDLVRGVTSAVNPLDNPELAAMTLAGRTDQEGAGVLGTGMAGVTFGAGVGLGKKGAVKGAQAIVDARFAQMDAPSVPTSDYGINPDLDAAHNQASNVLRRVDPKSAARMDYLRSTLPQGARLYVLPAARFSQEVAAALGSPEGTKFTDPGFYRRNADGTSDLFLNSNTVALGHEVGHAVQHLMPAEDRGALTDAIRAAYTPEQIAAFGQHYDSLLSAAQSEHRISARPDLIVEEMGAEILSKVLLAQKVRGVPPTIAKQVVDFTSRLAEDLGLYKPDVGVSKAEGGTDLGVRPSVAVAEKAETILGKLADTTEASRPPVIPGSTPPPPGGTPPAAPRTPPTGGASSGTPPATPPATPLAATPPAATPPAATPPAAPPAAPAVSINPRPRPANLRVTPDDQAAADARRKISGADEAERAIAANPGVYTAETAAVFRSINDAMQRPQGEVAPVRLDYRSVNAAPGSGTNARQRGSEQEAAYIAETMGALPEEVRTLADKMTVPNRWVVRGKNVNLLAMSVDKVLANARKTAEKLKGTPVTIPYDVRDGRFSDLAWQQMVDDLQAYTKNLANGFTGEGGRIVQPAGYEGVIPAENPNYQPTVLDSAKADFLNAMMGVAPPQTAKTPGGFKGRLVESFPNVQAASVAEASGRPVIRPAAVARPGKETYTQGGASTPIAETNPFRQAAAAAGVDLSGRNLFQVTEELNLQDIQAATAEPKSGFRGPPTDALRAGFMPDSGQLADDRKSGKAFKNFFSDVTKGAEKYRPKTPWKSLLPLEEQRAFVEEYAKHTGNFDAHIAASIPGFKDVQVRVGNALLKSLPDGARVLDVGASEGSFAKTISALSDGNIETVALDPNPDMAEFFRKQSTVPGSTYVEEAFLSGFEDGGKVVPAYAPKDKFDAIHESMVFQFISPDRADQIAESKRMLSPEGVFITEEKLLLPQEQWAANERKKDTQYKNRYFTGEDLKAKQAVVKFQQDPNEQKAVGMVDNMVTDTAFEEMLRANFKHVAQYWDSGNFRGYAASDSRETLDRFVHEVGDTTTDFTEVPTPREISTQSGFMPEAINPRKARKLDVRARQMFGQPYGNLFQSQRNDVEASVAKDEAKTPKGHTDAITTSDGFKQWFGDWEDPNAFSSKSTKGPVSVAVGGDGAPLRVFHSTRGDFNQFESRRKTYDNFGILGNVETFRNAVFFSDSVAQAEDYSTEGDSGKFYPKSRTVPAYLSIKSPIDFTNSGLDYEGLAEELGVSYGYLRNRTNVWELFDGAEGEFLVEAAKKAGYDGAIFNEDRINRSADDVGRTFAVFDPGQIKSAIANKGTFDPKNPDIRFMPTMAEYEARKAARDPKPVIRAATKTAGGIQLRPKEPLPSSVGALQRLIRYSSQAGEEIADPANFGRGAATARDRRGANKTFWFNEGSRTGADAAVVATAGKTAYGVSVDGGAIYDALGDDPLNWEGDINRVKADERVRDAGYTGVRTKSADGRSVTVLFEPVKQTELGRLIRPAKRAVNPGNVRFMPTLIPDPENLPKKRGYYWLDSRGSLYDTGDFGHVGFVVENLDPPPLRKFVGPGGDQALIEYAISKGWVRVANQGTSGQPIFVEGRPNTRQKATLEALSLSQERSVVQDRFLPLRTIVQYDGSSGSGFMPSTDEVREKMKTSALNVLHDDSPILPAPPIRKVRKDKPPIRETRTNAEVAKMLQKAAQDQWGRIITSYDLTPEERETIISNAILEVETALASSGKNAANWYTTSVAKAMETAATIYPEIESDEAARATGHFPDAASAKLALSIALAITSQNLKVSDNAKYTLEQFDHFRKTGKFDPSKEYGTKAPSISGNLELANTLISEMGWEAAREFLSRDFTVRDLSKVVSELVGEEVSLAGRRNDIVQGSALFGPKIGQGFLQNLRGNYTPVTVDLWMRRTWGRWTGDVVGDGVNPIRLARLIDASRESGIKLPDSLKSVRPVIRRSGKNETGKPFRTVTDKVAGRLEEDTEFRDQANSFAKDLAEQWVYKKYKAIKEHPVSDELAAQLRAGETDLDAIIDHQVEVLARLDTQFENLKVRPKKDAWREEKLNALGHNSYLTNKEISSNKPEWALAAISIKNDLNPTDVPTDQDREVITSIINDVRERLKNRGIDTTNADLQAILWYPEKDLWAKLQGESADELNTSYDEEFTKLAATRNSSQGTPAAAGTARSGVEGAAGKAGGPVAQADGAAPEKVIAAPMDNTFASLVSDVATGKKPGVTLNSDGSEFATPDAPSDVVTLASVNVPESSLTPDVVRAILASWGSVLQNPSVKPGLFRLENQSGPQMVSVDLNVVVPQTHRENTAAFARDNQQESFFDLSKFEVVRTGGSGQTVLTKPAQWVSAAADLAAGKPVDVAKLSQP